MLDLVVSYSLFSIFPVFPEGKKPKNIIVVVIHVPVADSNDLRVAEVLPKCGVWPAADLGAARIKVPSLASTFPQTFAMRGRTAHAAGI